MKIKRPQLVLILSITVLLIITFSVVSSNIEGKTEGMFDVSFSLNRTYKPIDDTIKHLSYLTPANFSWTAVSIECDNHERALFETTIGDSYSYSISENLIYIEEISSSWCHGGVYATVNVTNGYLAFSCEMKIQSNNSYTTNGFIKLYNASTLYPIENIPQLGYTRDEVTTLSDYNYMGANYSLPGASEVIMFIYIRDAWTTFYDQKMWVKDLKIYIY